MNIQNPSVHEKSFLQRITPRYLINTAIFLAASLGIPAWAYAQESAPITIAVPVGPISGPIESCNASTRQIIDGITYTLNSSILRVGDGPYMMKVDASTASSTQLYGLGFGQVLKNYTVVPSKQGLEAILSSVEYGSFSAGTGGIHISGEVLQLQNGSIPNPTVVSAAIASKIGGAVTLDNIIQTCSLETHFFNTAVTLPLVTVAP